MTEQQIWAVEALIASILPDPPYKTGYVNDGNNVWWTFRKGNAWIIVTNTPTTTILNEVKSILDNYEF